MQDAGRNFVDKKIAIGAILVLLIAVLFMYKQPLSEKYIKAEIEKANYCNFKEDCVNIGSVCPFGCDILVNKNEAKRISGLIGAFQDCTFGVCKFCDYMCIQFKGIDCIDKKCMPIR